MAFGFVQTKTGTTSATFTSAPTNGHLLVAYVYNLAAGTPTITGWTALTNYTTGGGSAQSCTMFWKISAGSETGAITPSTTSANIVIIEYSGNATSSPVDVETAALPTNVGSAYTSSSLTPTSTVERLFVFAVGHKISNAVPTATVNGSSTGVNVRSTGANTDVGVGDLIIASTSGSYSAVVTFASGTGAGANSVAMFKPAPVTSIPNKVININQAFNRASTY